MSLWQYKDASRSELWEILQIQLEETQQLTAELDDLQTYFDSCYEELQATRSAHDKIEQEHDELLNNQAKRDLLMKAEAITEARKYNVQRARKYGSNWRAGNIIQDLQDREKKLTKQADGE